MSLKPLKRVAAAITSATLILAPFTSALAGGMGSGYGGGYSGGGHSYGGGYKPDCDKGGHSGSNLNIYKPVTINKNINVFKPVVINKNININKNLNINKNININKNVLINKNIIINKGGGGGSAMADAFAKAMATASANASSSSSSVSYSGSYSDVTVVNRGGYGGGVVVAGAAAAAGGECEMQEATIVKAIHAVCITVEGREFAASHMLRDTWIDSGYEGEVARCIAGAHLKIVVGDVLQSDQGMAGTYSHGDVLVCGDHEALRHFKDGQLKCAPAEPVPDCTERTNLRKYGTGDFFFSYRGKVCVGAKVASVEQDTSASAAMEMDGGVGPQDESSY